MVSGYFQVSRVVGWLVFLAISVTLAGWYFAAFAAWLSALARRGVAGPLTVAAGWGVCEFARSRLLVGNPWALAGYSQVSFPSLMQMADVTGPYGVGMLVAGVNAAAAGAVVSALRGRRPLRSALVLVFALGAALGYGQWRLGQEFGSGPRLRVALVQGAVPARFRWQPGFRAASMDRYLALSDDAAAEGPQLVVWPENAIDFYLQEPSPEAEAVLARSRALHADLIVNGPRYAFEGERTVYRNTVFVLHDGRIAAPPRQAPAAAGRGGRGTRWTLARDTNYSPGRHPELLEAAGARIGSLVCFEVMYPELVRPIHRPRRRPARQRLERRLVRRRRGRTPSPGHRLRARDREPALPAARDLDRLLRDRRPARAVSRRARSTSRRSSAARSVSSRPTPYQRVGDLAAWLAVLTAAGCSASRTETKTNGGGCMTRSTAMLVVLLLGVASSHAALNEPERRVRLGTCGTDHCVWCEDQFDAFCPATGATIEHDAVCNVDRSCDVGPLCALDVPGPSFDGELVMRVDDAPCGAATGACDHGNGSVTKLALCGKRADNSTFNIATTKIDCCRRPTGASGNVACGAVADACFPRGNPFLCDQNHQNCTSDLSSCCLTEDGDPRPGVVGPADLRPTDGGRAAESWCPAAGSR